MLVLPLSYIPCYSFLEGLLNLAALNREGRLDQLGSVSLAAKHTPSFPCRDQSQLQVGKCGAGNAA